MKLGLSQGRILGRNGHRCCRAAAAVANPHKPIASPRYHYDCVSIAQQTREVRERLFKECLGGGLLYLESGEQVLRNGADVFHPHRADSNFLYVTGINQPSFGCLLDVDAGRPPVPMAPCSHAALVHEWMGLHGGHERLCIEF